MLKPKISTIWCPRCGGRLIWKEYISTMGMPCIGLFCTNCPGHYWGTPHKDEPVSKRQAKTDILEAIKVFRHNAKTKN